MTDKAVGKTGTASPVGLYSDIDQYADCHHITQQRGQSITQKWEGQSCVRQDRRGSGEIAIMKG